MQRCNDETKMKLGPLTNSRISVLSRSIIHKIAAPYHTFTVSSRMTMRLQSTFGINSSRRSVSQLLMVQQNQWAQTTMRFSHEMMSCSSLPLPYSALGTIRSFTNTTVLHHRIRHQSLQQQQKKQQEVMKNNNKVAGLFFAGVAITSGVVSALVMAYISHVQNQNRLSNMMQASQNNDMNDREDPLDIVSLTQSQSIYKLPGWESSTAQSPRLPPN
jgi:hypothetical protein